MTKAKVKLYGEDRHFIGETTIEVPDDVTVLSFGPEFFIRCAAPKTAFRLANGLALKNGEVSW